jgi:hypothetical protein
VAAGSSVDHGLDPSVADGLLQRGVVLDGLVGVPIGEADDGPVELVAGAEVPGDGGGVARPRVRTGQGDAAQEGVAHELVRGESVDRDRSLHVAQLAHVVVVTVGPGRPAEEHVARRLHEPLPGDDPLALVPVSGRAGVGREDRRLCFLDLQEQRRTVVVVHQQRHVTAGPDAADAHDLPGRVHHPVPIQQHPAFGTHRLETRLDDLPGYVELVLCVEDERRVFDDPASPLDQLGQLRERGEAGVLPGVRDQPLDRARGRRRAPPGEREHGVDVDALVPDVER